MMLKDVRSDIFLEKTFSKSLATCRPPDAKPSARRTAWGRSGLGLEAQRAANTQFAEREGYTIVAEFAEVETGKGSDALERRPELAAALAEAKRCKCPVVVAKLDRLSRDCISSAG